MTIDTRYFDELTRDELYQLYRLRSEIFIVEQECSYQDVDEKDQHSYHLLMWENGLLIGCARIVKGGIPSIGRVAIKKEFRNRQLGRQLMDRALSETKRLFGHKPVKISAQRYLQSFYESFGFVVCSEPYLEDNIPHIGMELRL